jgi:hypothetical protein
VGHFVSEHGELVLIAVREKDPIAEGHRATAADLHDSRAEGVLGLAAIATEDLNLRAVRLTAEASELLLFLLRQWV